MYFVCFVSLVVLVLVLFVSPLQVFRPHSIYFVELFTGVFGLFFQKVVIVLFPLSILSVVQNLLHALFFLNFQLLCPNLLMVIDSLRFVLCNFFTHVCFVISITLRHHIVWFVHVLSQVESGSTTSCTCQSCRHNWILQHWRVVLVDMPSDAIIRLHHLVRFRVWYLWICLSLLFAIQ